MAKHRISLYRKWRPQTFEEVVGQPHVTNTLANALTGDRLVHAYLFCGPRGTGKTSTARILAKAINCEHGPTATPCGECEACRSITAGTAMDVIEIDAASNRGIDEIRDLIDKIPYEPSALRKKVYIIDEVHQLSGPASSALLKTLEEPPEHAVFVLATTESNKILPTIVSRCQRFDFSLVSAPALCERLSLIADSEGIEVDEEALAMIAEHAHGSVRDAIGVMDQIANLSGELVTGQQVAELLGEVESELVFEMVDNIADRDTAGALSLVGRLVDDGKDPRRFVESLIAHLRSLFLIQNAANPREIVEATDEHFARLAAQSEVLRRYEVIRLIERLGETHRDMRYSENARLALECALVKATTVDADVTLEGLLFRLEELEKRVVLAQGGEAVAAPPVREAPPAPKAAEKPAAATTSPQAAPTKQAQGQPAQSQRRPVPFATGPQASPSVGTTAERDKAKRAWSAVLGELKKEGQMKLYALMTRAKIAGVSGDEVMLAFPGNASFQLEVLAEGGEVEKLQQLFARFFGREMKFNLAGGEQPAAPRLAPAAPAATGKQASRKPALAVAAEAEGEGAAGEGEETAGAAEAATGDPAPGPASSKELAQMLKESFDGEIIESSEGKE